MNDPIIIIGGGRMGGALATRWRTSLATSAGIHIVEPDAEVRKELAANGSGVHVHAGLADFRLMRGIVVLAVKPQVFELIADDIRKTFAKGSILFVSIMAGVPLAELEDLGARVVRIMPNTPALVGEAMTVACNPKLERGARATITKLFEAVGRVIWVEDEELMHAVTAISGSGPAYVYAFMEALNQAAKILGLPLDLARPLVVQTVLGTAMMAAQQKEDFAILRRQVTSPGGTTEAALTELYRDNVFTKLVVSAARAAERRSRKMAEEHSTVPEENSAPPEASEG